MIKMNKKKKNFKEFPKILPQKQSELDPTQYHYLGSIMSICRGGYKFNCQFTTQKLKQFGGRNNQHGITISTAHCDPQNQMKINLMIKYPSTSQFTFNVLYNPLWKKLISSSLCKVNFYYQSHIPYTYEYMQQCEGFAPVKVDIYLHKSIYNEYSESILGPSYNKIIQMINYYKKIRKEIQNKLQKYRNRIIKESKKYFKTIEQQKKYIYYCENIYLQNYKLYHIQNEDKFIEINFELISNNFQLYLQCKQLKQKDQQYKKLLINLEIRIENQKLIRLFLQYLLEITQVKIINRCFIKPKSKSNYFKRWYRKQTIGIIERNNSYLWQKKNKKWSYIFPRLTEIKHLILKQQMINKQQQFNYNNQYIKGWQLQKDQIYHKLIQKQKYRSQMDYNEILIEKKKQFIFNQKQRIFNQLGIIHQNIKNNIEYKNKNQILLKQFQDQNKHFKALETPQGMLCQLKYYQSQALTWMMYRQGRLEIDNLFEQGYIDQKQDFEFQRKLSPFWQEIKLPMGQQLYINYLTGQFTKEFHQWKSIKGGILADQMGLGKTVMAIALMAKDQWYGTNLIVVPVNVIRQWKQQIQKFTENNVTIIEYHCDLQKRKKLQLNEYKVILTTYGTLGSQYKKYKQYNEIENKNKYQKYLFNYKFRRIILDQAHNIKCSDTLQFLGAITLQCQYRWCMTGTLIQNNQDDLFALFRFLGVEVFCQQYWWNQYIKNCQIEQQKFNIIHTVLRPIVLRRTKKSTDLQGKCIIELVQKKQYLIKPYLTQNEYQIYKQLQKGIKKYFKNLNNVNKTYTHIFQIISKLRQFCCHPSLIFGCNIDKIKLDDIDSILNSFLNGNSDIFKKGAIITIMNSSSQTCPICLEQPYDQAVMTNCGHLYCQLCLKKQINIRGICAICRKIITNNSFIRKIELPKSNNQQLDITTSSKMQSIIIIILEIYNRNQKCIIFSQWLRIIDILRNILFQKNIGYCSITGSMGKQARNKTVELFRNNSKCQFMIVSIKAGGTGLNLTMANNVIICDPWWNPANQDQAINRVHRIGQTKQVNVYRFIMKDTIEQKILKMHQKKRKLADRILMKKQNISNNLNLQIEVNQVDQLIAMMLNEQKVEKEQQKQQQQRRNKCQQQQQQQQQ